MASRSIAPTSATPWRAYARLGAIAGLLVALVPLHYTWRVARRRSPWPRRFLRWSGRAAGLQVTTTGPVPTRDTLLLANHTSWLDILALAGETGTAYVAKAEMIGWPALGWMASLNNSVFVDRDARTTALEQAATLRRFLATGQPLTLFPEGTTGDGRTLCPFRSSLLAAVAPPPSGITVQPVAIDFGAAATEIAWTDDESIGENAIPILQRRGRLPVTLRFLPPLAPADRKTMTREARAAIAAALVRA